LFLCSIPVLHCRPRLFFLPRCSPAAVERPDPFPATTDVLPRALWIFPTGFSHRLGAEDALPGTTGPRPRAGAVSRSARLTLTGSDFQLPWICSATASSCFCFLARIFPHSSPDSLLLEPCPHKPAESPGCRSPVLLRCQWLVFLLSPVSF
jgi:hypothetical protein